MWICALYTFFVSPFLAIHFMLWFKHVFLKMYILSFKKALWIHKIYNIECIYAMLTLVHIIYNVFIYIICLFFLNMYTPKHSLHVTHSPILFGLFSLGLNRSPPFGIRGWWWLGIRLVDFGSTLYSTVSRGDRRWICSKEDIRRSYAVWFGGGEG